MVNGGICSCVAVVNAILSIVYMLICIAGQRWICSCADLVNGGLAHVKLWQMVDMLRCSGGQLRICSCVGVINGHMLICISGQ